MNNENRPPAVYQVDLKNTFSSNSGLIEVRIIDRLLYYHVQKEKLKIVYKPLSNSTYSRICMRSLSRKLSHELPAAAERHETAGTFEFVGRCKIDAA